MQHSSMYALASRTITVWSFTITSWMGEQQDTARKHEQGDQVGNVRHGSSPDTPEPRLPDRAALRTGYQFGYDRA
jgi:hypothetical protein